MLPLGPSKVSFAPDAIKTVNKNLKTNLNDTVRMKMYSTNAQDVSINSYKKRLKTLEKELEECKRENYETFEEYMQEKSYLREEYEELQELLCKHDIDYTNTNTDARNKTLGAVGGFFKDIGTAIKTMGTDIINTIAGFLGISPKN